jgi:hypothetical protein
MPVTSITNDRPVRYERPQMGILPSVIALTVFAKTKMRETGEIARAAAAMAQCQQEGHSAEEEG